MMGQMVAQRSGRSALATQEKPQLMKLGLPQLITFASYWLAQIIRARKTPACEAGAKAYKTTRSGVIRRLVEMGLKGKR